MKAISKKWIDAAIGLSIYLVWRFSLKSLNIFVAYTASIPLYFVLFFVLLILAVVRKNVGGICGFMVGTMAPLCFYGFSTGENKAGTLILMVLFLVCLYELFKDKISKLGKTISKVAEKRKRSDQTTREWFRSLRWTGLLLALLLAGVRGSDLIVSKLYYVPWPIYPDYVYPAGVEKISFQSLDGTLLNGWYFRGKSTEASQRPVILYIHGNAGNMAAQLFQFDFLMDWGYDVFTFDYRGFGLSEGRPSREGLWKDTQAAFHELTRLQPGREYGVVGFSMGAPYALQLAAHEQRVSAAAFLACFSSFRDIGSYTLGAWGLPQAVTPFLTWLLVPHGFDPINAVEISRLPPALFVHGTADGNVPSPMGEKLHQYYQGPKQFLLMPGYGHGDYFKGPLGETFRKALDGLFLGPGRSA